MIIESKDINSIGDIYKTIHSINNKMKNIANSNNVAKVFPIFFSNDVEFVFPLFLALLLITHDKYRDKELLLVIDIIGLQNTKQHHVLRMLLQNIDMPYFKLINDANYDKNSRDYIPKEPNTTIRERYYQIQKTDNYGVPVNSVYKLYKGTTAKSGNQSEAIKVFLYHTVAHKDSIFCEKGSPFIKKDSEELASYRHLMPIFKISNFPLFVKDDIHYQEDKNTTQDIVSHISIRKTIYEKMLITGSNYDKDAIDDILSKMLPYIRPAKASAGLDKAFKTFFLELIDNVKHHAESDVDSGVNSYFNFYYDKKADEFRFFVIDDAKQGFLNRYMEILEKELKEIQSFSENNEIINGFLEEINSLKSDIAKNDKEILKNLFSLDANFAAHQIPRIVMHFGIPILIESIKELGGTFYIRLHRTNKEGKCRFYELQIDNNHKLNIKEIDAGIEGTYIYIAIPSKSKPKNTAVKPLDPPIEEYSYILNTEKEIGEKISKFKIVDKINQDNNEDKQVIFDYKKYISKYPNNSISDALRDIYKIAYTKKFDDILVINFPLALNMSYMNILVKILYEKDHPLVSRYPVNVVYYDNLTYDILFIGGKNRAEFCASNHIIKTKYTSDREYPEVISAICNDFSGTPAKSAFFYQDDERKWHLLPMSSFKKESASEDYFKSIKVSDLHVEVNEEYHVGKFFDLKDTINNSLKDKRIAYYFASKIKKSYPNKEVIFIGVGKSSAITISRMQIILNQNKKFFVYSKAIDHKDRQQTKLNEFIEQHKNDFVVIFVPVIASMNTIKDFFADLKNNNDKSIKKVFNTIRLDIGKENSIVNIPIDSFLTIDKKDLDIQQAKSCKYCFPKTSNDEKPLYRLDKTGYRPKNYFQNNFDHKSISSKSHILINTKWKNLISTGHIEKTNHYYFYVKTINLFESNRAEIIKWLSGIKVELKERNIIFAPKRSTNNNFIVLIEKILFKGDADIHRFDRKEFDENLYNLKNINIGEKDNVYFVDDEVDTGATVEYFYGILQKATNYKNKKFKKIITLLDRTSKKDDDILSNFIDNNDDYHYFLSVAAQPIKTHEEKCFLCDRRKDYIELFKQCTIDLTRFQFLERIIKLQDTSAIELKYDLDENSIKNFIKLYMVEEILQSNNFDYPKDKLTEVKKAIKKEYETEIKSIYSLCNNEQKMSFDRYLDGCINVEFRIAYYKALSFPKIVYNKQAREVVTKEIIDRLKEQIATENYAEFSKDQVEIEKSIANILEDERLSNNHIIKFATKERKKIDMVNILFSTAGYLDIKYLLNVEVISFYHKIFNNESNGIIKNRMHTYPFAVKMITSERKSSADKFDQNLMNFLGDNLETFKMDEYTKLRAMYLENIKVENDKLDIAEDIDIEKLKETIISYMGNNSIKEIQISVNHKYNIEYDTLAKYMLDSSLVDLSSYALMDRAIFEKEYMVYDGIVSKEENGTKIPTSIKYTKEDRGKKQESARLNDIWANWYIERENRIIFRLVDIDDSRLHIENRGKCTEDFYEHLEDFLDQTKAIVPIGVMSVTLGANANIAEITRKLLVANKKIVAYLKKKFSTGVIQEAIQTKEYENIFRTFHHEVEPLFEIHNIIKPMDTLRTNSEIEEEIRKIKNYTLFMQEIVKIGKFKTIKSIDIYKPGYNFKSVYKDSKEVITDFIDIAKRRSSTRINEMIFDFENYEENIILPIPYEYFLPLFYELIFNALKNTDRKDNKLEIYTQNNRIIFKNKFIQPNDKNGDGIALSYLNHILDLAGYKLETNQDDTYYYVSIYHKKEGGKENNENPAS